MSKKNKFFSWLGFGKKKQQEPQEEQAKVTTEEPESAQEARAETEQQAPQHDVAQQGIGETVSEHVSSDATSQDALKASESEKPKSVEVESDTEASAGIFVSEQPPTVLPSESNDIPPNEPSLSSEKSELPTRLDTVTTSEKSPPVVVEEPLTETVEPSNDVTQVEPPVDAEVKETSVTELVETPVTELVENTHTPEDGAVIQQIDEDVVESAEPQVTEAEEPQAKPEKKGFFKRLKEKLTKTKQSIGSGLANLFLGKKIDDELYEDLETQMLMADVGVDTTLKIINRLTEHADRKQLKDGDALYEKLKEELTDMLQDVDKPLDIDTSKSPYVILMVGVNGVGKTTTIGKMAKQLQADGKSVMLAAGDTFRAAAVEQLQVWGERNDIPVVAQHTGADSASVIFDAFESAKSRGVDVLIADTAGRLQNKDNLMEELKKVVRVMQKLSPDAPHEIMLTVDAGTGQNAISQAKLFNEAVGVTGITLTKLDGTAKGGVIFSIADQFTIPIRYIGVGEGIDDLRPFNSQDFIDAIFSQEVEEA